VGFCSVEDMFEKRVAGSVSSGACATPEATAEATAAGAAAVGGGAGACVDSGELVDRLVGLRAQAARLDAEMLGLMSSSSPNVDETMPGRGRR
jgi:hypothetical protein